jgi:hypothetical protein
MPPLLVDDELPLPIGLAPESLQAFNKIKREEREKKEK